MPKLNKLYSRKQIDALRLNLIAEHGNQCAICKRPRTDFKNNLSVDHNHVSGKVRGLLCFYCNKMKVGRHSIETAKQILDYLTKYDVPSNKENK
jgi:hypothetical protein